MKTSETSKISKKKLIILTGPTSSGKTSLSLELARTFSTEIISADSMHVYKRFDIGTGKPSGKSMRITPHHLIDIIEADQDFDAWNYMQLARQAIDRIDKNCLIVSGGTQLYIKSLIEGLASEIPKDSSYRLELRNDLEKYGLEKLYKKLCLIDPESANRINPNDTQRVLRYLEINKVSGQKPSVLYANQGISKLDHCDTIKTGLLIEKRDLDELINKRVELMIEGGLIDEVENLINLFGFNVKPLQSIGYKEVCSYLKGEVKKGDAIEKIKTNTRRLAKRQLTWLKKDKDMVWYKSSSELIAACTKFAIN